MPLAVPAIMPEARLRWSALALACAVLVLLAGCAGPGSQESGLVRHHHRYSPPGPPGDPWGPYINEAALRFGVPAQWVRAVIRQESGGRDDAISVAGAIGLMQVMPSTYAMLRARYGLGDDPYEPHDNIMAGTAYIRELYDRYGAPGFLAAYNAGPNRLDSYLANGTPLPEETVGYLASVAPNLGSGTALSGPLAVYAGSAEANPAPYAPPVHAAPPVVMASARATSAACDPDAAYDPDRPCAPLPTAFASSEEPSPQPVITTSALAMPPSPPPYAYPAAYPAPSAPHAVLPPLVYASGEPASAAAVRKAKLSVAASGEWAIQVGAFRTRQAADAAAEMARSSAPAQLSAAAVSAPPTSPFGSTVLYRARLQGLSPAAAGAACAALSARGMACMAVPPGA